jgi:site-specific DNA recombinase
LTYNCPSVLGLKTRAQVIAATRRANQRIGEIDELLNAGVTSDPLAAVINAPDPVAAWDALPLADQRLFIDRVCTATILPSGRTGRGFDPTTLDIAPKHRLGRGTLAAA